MSQDIVADALNQMMNAKRAKRTSVIAKRVSSLLINLLEIMKGLGYVDYSIKNKEAVIIIKDLSECRAIKPRYTVSNDAIGKYVRRFLPSRDIGFVIVSTNKGLMTHREAQESKIGGSLIAYFY